MEIRGVNTNTINKLNESLIISNNCNNCDELLEYDSDVCKNCGLVKYFSEFSNYKFETDEIINKNYRLFTNSKINKINNWLQYSNIEKNEYRLKLYIIELCKNLDISNTILDQTILTVSQVMKCIKDNTHSSKRSRVKDGIIIMCIYYVSKINKLNYSYVELAKKYNLDIKYITKANKIMMELITHNKIDIPKELMFEQKEPMDYVNNIIQKYKLNINNDILNDVNNLINICNEHDLLLGYNELSIGVGCFYYVLMINNINLDLKMFSKIYNISNVTIRKIYNQLLLYKLK